MEMILGKGNTKNGKNSVNDRTEHRVFQPGMADRTEDQATEATTNPSTNLETELTSSSSSPSSSAVVVINVEEQQLSEEPSVSNNVRNFEEIVQLPTDSAPDGKVCRVCHLGSPEVAGEMMELSCACKDDLAAAHRKCAEAWFEVRGNRKCEICGRTVTNIALQRGIWKRILGPDIELVDPNDKQLCNLLIVVVTVLILFPLLGRLSELIK